MSLGFLSSMETASFGAIVALSAAFAQERTTVPDETFSRRAMSHQRMPLRRSASASRLAASG